MKVKIELLILGVIFLLSSYLIYTYVDSDTKNIITNEEIQFKEEYEKLNGLYNENIGHYYMNMEIVENSNVEYKTAEELIDILKNGTGIIYFGFPECPWCRNIVPILVNTLQEYGISFYYYNAYDIRDQKHLDENGTIITDKEGTKEYYEILSLLGDSVSEYVGLNDSSHKRLYFPTIVFVKNGEVVTVHQGTIESQTNPYVELTLEQKDEIISILEQAIAKTYDIVCNENC